MRSGDAGAGASVVSGTALTEPSNPRCRGDVCGVFAHDVAEEHQDSRVFSDRRCRSETAVSGVAERGEEVETVQHWKQMLNYLDTICADRIREAGHRQ